MTLRDYYGKLEPEQKKVFLGRVTKATGKTQATIYRWLNGENTPSKSDKEKIARISGLQTAELF